MDENLYWDTSDPYHYVRFHHAKSGHQYIIVGGEDHRTGQRLDSEDKFMRLQKWAQEHFPTMNEITHRWSGQVLEPADALPFIGRDPVNGKNIYIATGTSGNGITYGTTAALLIRDLISKHPNPLAKLFSPGRLCLKGLDRLLTENFCSALQYSQNLKINSKQKFCSHLNAGLTENICENSLDCPAHGSRFNQDGEVICGPAIRDL